VASTISFDAKQSAFLQEGCAPNYLGGLWTLTCCKHAMRSAQSFKTAVKSGDCATVILTLSKVRCPDHRQYLVSAAKVTAWFDTMDDYAKYLLKLGDERLLSEKLSRERRATGLGWHFGDCHADRDGRVDEPVKGHVHKGKDGRDRDGNHLLLASDSFVVWKCPTLRAKSLLYQSRYGLTVTPDNRDRNVAGAGLGRRHQGCRVVTTWMPTQAQFR
jgi:hypothetical protein